MTNILLVDDSAVDRLLIRRILGKAERPFFVAEAAAVEIAIAYLLGEGEFSDRALHPLPELIVCDLQLFVKGGFDLIDFVRSHHA